MEDINIILTTNMFGTSHIRVEGPVSASLEPMKRAVEKECREAPKKGYWNCVVEMPHLDLDTAGLVDLATFFNGLYYNSPIYKGCILELDSTIFPLENLVTLVQNIGKPTIVSPLDTSPRLSRLFLEHYTLITLVMFGMSPQFAYLVVKAMWYYDEDKCLYFANARDDFLHDDDFRVIIEEGMEPVMAIPPSERHPTIGNLPPYLVTLMVDYVIVDAIFTS